MRWGSGIFPPFRVCRLKASAFLITKAQIYKLVAGFLTADNEVHNTTTSNLDRICNWTIASLWSISTIKLIAMSRLQP